MTGRDGSGARADAPTDAVVARYLAGEATGEERSTVDRWAASSPANRAELDRLREAWKLRGPRDTWDVERAWKRVSSAGAEGSAPRGKRTDAALGRVSWAARPMVRLAAAIVLVVGGLFAWQMFTTEPVGGATQLYATAAGETLEVELEDGTSVTLSPESMLRVAAGYGASERRVDLTGEAWFEVVHDESRPFEVHAVGTITRDIGTAFVVRALTGDTLVRVAVTEGVASLRRTGEPVADAVTLNARDVGTLGGAGEPSVQRGVNVEQFVAWRTGTLDFSNATLADVVTELDRWYAVAFRFADTTLRTRRVTAPIPTNDLAESLEILSRTLGVTLERTGDTVVVR